MEKYGCNRLEEVNNRIKEIEKVSNAGKTASEKEELKDLYQARQELQQEQAKIQRMNGGNEPS